MEKSVFRAQVPVEQTWDLCPIFETEKAFEEAFTTAEQQTDSFVARYDGTWTTAEQVNEALSAYALLLAQIERLEAYASLQVEEDTSNKGNAQREARAASRLAALGKKVAYVPITLAHAEETIREEAARLMPEHARYLARLAKDKPHFLSVETEATLAAMAPTLNAPEQIYADSKFGDTVFPPFSVDGKTITMTYNTFENHYEAETNHALRHQAAEVFYAELARHRHVTASAYNSRVQQEKIEATLRGYDSVFSFLLADQEVPRELYDRQIDVIMQDLAPIMQKYARLLQRVYGLSSMTSYDLKLELDPSFVSTISYTEAATYIKDGLSILGEDYVQMLSRAFDERWIDYAENVGKCTGAFCAEVYGVHPYILSSFNHRMDEVATLAHELGHAGQSVLTCSAQPYLNKEMSLYMVESPSTTNELIMENYLLQKAGDNKRERRWVLSQMLSKTYYHNFVTHLLEAAYQREVYRIVDRGGSVDADELSGIYRDVLTRFWGDAVEIKDGSTLTWMRQPHYYNGLYSYTYSAGLTVGTQMALRLMASSEVAGKADAASGKTCGSKQNEVGQNDRSADENHVGVSDRQTVVHAWRSFLSAGGSLDPIAQAALVGVDITTDKPLKETIAYIGSIVDELVELS